MIDFLNAKSIVTPKGEIALITRGAEILFRKQKYKRELAYLESTGTQWIDTGVEVVSSLPSVKIKFHSTHYKSYFVGVHNNGSRQAGISKTDASTVCILNYQRDTTTIGVRQETEWNEVFVDGVNRQLTADGNTVSMNGGFTWYSSNRTSLALFGVKLASVGTANCSRVSIAYCELYDGSMNLIRDFIPVLDWNDRPCMYDKVTDELFYNQGTGEFLYAEKAVA